MATVLNVGVFNKVLASTIGNYADKLGMQVYNASPVLAKIVDKGNKRKWEGESTRIKVVGAEYKAAQSYQDFDTGNTGVSQPFTRADYELGGYIQFVTLGGMDIRKNSASSTRIFDLAKTETMVAVASVRKAMATHLFQSTNDAKGILSLSTITDASTTIAGIAGSSNWGGTTTTSGSFALQGKTDLWTLHLTLSQYASLGNDLTGSDEPDLYVMNNTTGFRYYIAAMEPNMRYTPGGKGDVGFGSVAFMGKEVVGDPYCASGNIYSLNTDHLFVYVMPAADMAVQEDRMSYNQDAWTVPILWNGQIVVDARRYHGKLASVAA